MFDLALDWIILSPEGADFETVHKTAADLARIIGLLRQKAGLERKPPAIMDAQGPAPSEDKPVIVLNAEADEEERGETKCGWSWRAGNERIEIYGNSLFALNRAIYDFCKALGLKWELPGQESLPVLESGKSTINLLRPSNYRSEIKGPAELRRFEFPLREKEPEMWQTEAEVLLLWLLRIGCEALLMPFMERNPRFLSRFTRRKEADLWRKVLNQAPFYGIRIEAGGWGALSFLLPRSWFHRDKDMFRMEAGERVADHLFCPTNPETLRVLEAEAAKQFMPGFWPEHVQVFQLWPDSLHSAWCSCPACRAFNQPEQNLMACNGIADVLARLRPKARLGYLDIPARPQSETPTSIKPRDNMFAMQAGT